MKIELPPQVGIIPTFECDYVSDPHRVKYKAVIDVVGSYEDHGNEVYTLNRPVWKSEPDYGNVEDAVQASVDKLADMLRRLV